MSSLHFRLCSVITLLCVLSCSEPNSDSPVVSILSPAPYAIVNGTVHILCMASDANGIRRIELWVNGSNTGHYDNSEPFELLWDTDGLDQELDYIIVLRAIDNKGNITDSEPLHLDVHHSSLVGSWQMSFASVEVISRTAESGEIPSPHARGDTVIWIGPEIISNFPSWNIHGALEIFGDQTYTFSGQWLTIDHDSIPSPVNFYTFRDSSSWSVNHTISTPHQILLNNCHFADPASLVDEGNSGDSLFLQFSYATENHLTWANCDYTWFFMDCDDFIEISVYDTVRYVVKFSKLDQPLQSYHLNPLDNNQFQYLLLNKRLL